MRYCPITERNRKRQKLSPRRAQSLVGKQLRSTRLNLQELATLVPRAEGKGYAASPGVTAAGLSVFRVVVRMEHTARSFALLEIPQRERANLNELVLRAQLVADVPERAEGLSRLVAAVPRPRSARGALRRRGHRPRTDLLDRVNRRRAPFRHQPVG